MLYDAAFGLGDLLPEGADLQHFLGDSSSQKGGGGSDLGNTPIICGSGNGPAVLGWDLLSSHSRKDSLGQDPSGMLLVEEGLRWPDRMDEG